MKKLQNSKSKNEGQKVKQKKINEAILNLS